MSARHCYAKQSPRGFANEVKVHVFADRESRDAWVEEHCHDGDVNSAACGAEVCTAKEARSILGYRGDAATESYNGTVDHTRGEPSHW